MNQPLSQPDIQQLQAAFAALQAGDVTGAVSAISRVSPAGGSHPDGLYIGAQILIAQARYDDARRTLEALVSMAPSNAHVWNALGTLSSAEGKAQAAVKAFARAAVLDPKCFDFWLNLASARIDARQFEPALEALERAAGLAASDPRLWVLRGLAERGLERNAAAIASWSKALSLAPGDHAARHNLAEVLRATGKPGAALQAIGASDDMPIPSRGLRADILVDLGRFDEAIVLYQGLIAEQPGFSAAPAALARIMPQIGRAAEALDGWRAALEARGDDRDLWLAAIAAAKDNKAGAQLVDWCREWERRFGADPLVSLAHGIGLSLAGQRTAAIDMLRGLAERAPDQPGVHAHLAPLLLAEGDWDAGEVHALEASRQAPLDQSAWAWLALAWRLKQDPREAWLADYERLVMPVDLDLDPAFIAALADALGKLHVTSTHPADQSLRGGTQTNGNLFDRPLAEVQQLAARLHRATEAQIASLTPDAAHPFLSRLGNGMAFAGSWSVRLASAGFHTNHIHPMGWLSSACYVALPPEVAAPAAGLESPPGALQFGVPDAALGLDLAPRRVVLPRVGQLVLFPSYFWHGTVPFNSASPRLTVAFDAVPGSG